LQTWNTKILQLVPWKALKVHFHLICDSHAWHPWRLLSLKFWSDGGLRQTIRFCFISWLHSDYDRMFSVSDPISFPSTFSIICFVYRQVSSSKQGHWYLSISSNIQDIYKSKTCKLTVQHNPDQFRKHR
jgi:hypothetical protein